MPTYTKQQDEEFARFSEKLATFTHQELYEACKQYIWLSAYASNNPRSNYHRMCDACYSKCSQLGLTELYDYAWHTQAKHNFDRDAEFDTTGAWLTINNLRLEHYKEHGFFDEEHEKISRLS